MKHNVMLTITTLLSILFMTFHLTDAANENGIAMAFTGIRHFKH